MTIQVYNTINCNPKALIIKINLGAQSLSTLSTYRNMRFSPSSEE